MEKCEWDKFLGMRATGLGDWLDVEGQNEEKLKMTPKFLAWGN